MLNEIIVRKLFHDIRGSLSNLQGNTYLIRDAIGEQECDLAEFTQCLDWSQQRLCAEVEDLADLIAMERGELHLQLEKMNWSSAWCEHWKDLSKFPRWQDCELIMEPHDSEKEMLTITTDRQRLLRLVSHSLDFLRLRSFQTRQIQFNAKGLEDALLLTFSSVGELPQDLPPKDEGFLSQLPEAGLQNHFHLYLTHLLTKSLGGAARLKAEAPQLLLEITLPHRSF